MSLLLFDKYSTGLTKKSRVRRNFLQKREIARGKADETSFAAALAGNRGACPEAEIK